MPLGPDPQAIHPVPAHQRIVFLKGLIDDPKIEIGDYTYYDDPENALLFASRNVLHHYDFLGTGCGSVASAPSRPARASS
jgi:virginiamycin A acetyltransferase